MRRSPIKAEKCCPFLDEEHPICASRFSLQRLDEAFDYCLGQYFGCPNFARLVKRDFEATPATTRLTVNGRTAQQHVG